jgi:hypothetical protein
MMKRFRQIMLSTLLVCGVGMVTAPAIASAYDPLDGACAADSTSVLCQNRTKDDLGGTIKTIVNILLYILAAISVVFIILAGIYYTTSGGDSANVKKAKDTLLYSVVGLIVAILAYSIVNFVITNVTDTPTPTAPPSVTKVI